MPLISVVIPVYNRSKTLARAVRSVRIQGRDDMEIIIVDDGSTDRTPEVAESLAGPDLSYIRQENAGAAAARNLGINKARGEWIAFLDSDDEWLEGKIDAQMALLEKSGADFTFCSHLNVGPDGEERQRRAPLPRSNAELQDLLFRHVSLSTPTVIVRRSLLLEVGCFEEKLKTAQDVDLWFRLARFGSMAHDAEIRCRVYRADQGQTALYGHIRRALHALDVYRNSKPNLVDRSLYSIRRKAICRTYLRLAWLSAREHRKTAAWSFWFRSLAWGVRWGQVRSIGILLGLLKK